MRALRHCWAQLAMYKRAAVQEGWPIEELAYHDWRLFHLGSEYTQCTGRGPWRQLRFIQTGKWLNLFTLVTQMRLVPAVGGGCKVILLFIFMPLIRAELIELSITITPTPSDGNRSESITPPEHQTSCTKTKKSSVGSLLIRRRSMGGSQWLRLWVS